jgi:nucleoside-diphosphate-sugar epimerase
VALAQHARDKEAPMRIFFTGGSGKAGRHVAPYLAEQGHHVTNADLVPLRHPAVADLRVDLTDAGETYSALAGLATFDELDLPEKPTYDAVVHFAAVPAILLVSDAATYATNVLSTYNVLEAATRLGVRKIVFASSETTYGVCFAQGERRPVYVPVDEDHPTVPEDAYAMSKVAGEVTARSFQARTGADVYGLRINNVIEPDEYREMFPPFLVDPSLRRRNLFAYIDVRDLGQMVQRCLEVDGLGYEVFNVANADMSVAATTQELQHRFYDGVEVRREMAATRPSTPSTRHATSSASPRATPGVRCCLTPVPGTADGSPLSVRRSARSAGSGLEDGRNASPAPR